MKSELDTLLDSLGEKLLSKGWRVTTAESCTGGGIAEALTRMSGSSAWFEYGFVTYANGAKIKLLGVSEATLIEQGAVSEAVVKQMAAGALHALNANIVVAVSGIAGPTGGSADKPVGTVWFCWQHAGSQPKTECFYFAGDRITVRNQAVFEGIKGLLELIP